MGLFSKKYGNILLNNAFEIFITNSVKRACQ